jgi:hypothetical protein
MAEQALEKAVREIVTVLRTVSPFTNSNQVPLNPTSVQSYSTFAVVYPYTGSIDTGPTGSRKALHNIAIDVLTKNMDLARALESTKPLVDTVPLALLREVSFDSDSNPGQQFNNSISTFARITYQFIPQGDYGGVPVIGYHFAMEDVKILVNL